jgi:hypothetical protein
MIEIKNGLRPEVGGKYEAMAEAYGKKRDADMLVFYVGLGRKLGVEVYGDVNMAEKMLIKFLQDKLGTGKYTEQGEYTSHRGIPYLSYLYSLHLKQQG